MRGPIDLVDHSSNMQIGICWYQREPTNKRTYDHTNHLMVDLETIIALSAMTYSSNLGGATPGVFMPETVPGPVFRA